MPPLPTAAIFAADEAALAEVAAALAAAVSPPFVLFLRGELGAGKTAFARAFLRAAGAAAPFIKSPAYALVESYDLPGGVARHFDFFRTKEPGEWRDAGLAEYLPGALSLIEWPDKAAGLPPPDLSLQIDFTGEGRTTGEGRITGEGRTLRFAAHSEKGAQGVRAVKKC